MKSTLSWNLAVTFLVPVPSSTIGSKSRNAALPKSLTSVVVVGKRCNLDLTP
jgi:hypothetical protein